MDGAPLNQARRVVAALVESLTEADQLELMEFSDRARRWRPRAARATATAQQEALRWLAAIRAGGGTEMLDAVRVALSPLRLDSQRQVVLVTDGLVAFEREIVSAVARDLPANSRLHVVAVGPAPNRGLSATAARAGRGIEVVIGLDEEAAPAIGRLLAHMQAPGLMEVQVEGPACLAHVPARLADVYANAPLRVAVKLRAEGGELRVRGKTPEGVWEDCLYIPALGYGEGTAAVARLYGQEAVQDLEMREAAGLISQADREIERLGLAFQIATRATAWVAVSEEPTVDPTAPIRRERIPHELPYGMSAEGLGLRKPLPSAWAAPAVWARRPCAMEEIPPPRAYPARALVPGAIEWVKAEDMPPLPRLLLARLTVWEGRELILEIPISGSLDWYARDVRVIWEDGTEMGATIGEGTTRPGRVEAGQIIRLVLLLERERPGDAPIRIELKSLGTALHLSLRQ